MTDLEYMKIALVEAEKAFKKNEAPIGAVVVLNDKIIGCGYNQRETLSDPTAHAEMIAIREAAKYLGSWRLIDVEMFVTVEPCPMCAGAIYQARIKRLVYGADDPKAGAAGTLMNILQDKRLNHQTEVTGGVCEKESREILAMFFKKLR
ncbi:MAG: nucleoside deaminase [Actinobacteria bacterium]|nr:nucleoside deaminase [Actinomycetota bacterium]